MHTIQKNSVNELVYSLSFAAIEPTACAMKTAECSVLSETPAQVKTERVGKWTRRMQVNYSYTFLLCDSRCLPSRSRCG